MKATTRAWLALGLLAPVPSVAVTMAMITNSGPVGHAVFAAAKLWLLILPAAWFLIVERSRPRWTAPTLRGLIEGGLLGLSTAAAVVLAYVFIAADQLDPEPLRAAVTGMGFTSPMRFLAAASYWVLINSLLEEYVYRWFIVRQAEVIMPQMAAIVLSAAIFTAHHVIAIKVYLPWGFTLLASSGIFIGGLLWAWLFIRHQSLWAPWLAHIAADVAVFTIAWKLIF